MGEIMPFRIRARFALAVAAIAPAILTIEPAKAASLPEIKITATNAVPECATPGRLMSFVEGRNRKLDATFQTIAADYMRIGDELSIRWDTAFFQMLLETGNLTFTGDVQPSQNNFAGLGATGRKNPGETFPDVATGVRAHLEHLLLYAGETLDAPVAERTRKVQEWGVLTSWQKSISGPMTYALIAKKWAPTSRNYTRDIENVAEAFYAGACQGADPKPELLAMARPQSEKTVSLNTASITTPAAVKGSDTLSGADLARRAVEEARVSGSFVRSNLGAAALVAPASGASATPPAEQPTVTILNAAKAEAAAGERVDVAVLAPGAKAGGGVSSDANSSNGKCKVWTASYGGSRAVIIKARAEQLDNYTVLDVNEGAEKREAEAYIAAYAKGGETVGEFSSPDTALDKAFELCPEG